MKCWEMTSATCVTKMREIAHQAHPISHPRKRSMRIAHKTDMRLNFKFNPANHVELTTFSPPTYIGPNRYLYIRRLYYKPLVKDNIRIIFAF